MKNFKAAVFSLAVLFAAFFFANVGEARAQRGSVEWSGTVDDVVQITIRNRNVRTRHISGRDYDDAQYNFRGRAPRQNVNATVNKEEGRGRILIIQQPSRRNNWTTIVQVNDSKGGADRYRFTLYWD